MKSIRNDHFVSEIILYLLCTYLITWLCWLIGYKLQTRFSSLLSAVIVGTVWTFWHIPMFLFKVEGYHISFLAYLLQTVCLSVIVTWIFNHTKESLFAVILFHTVDDLVMVMACPSYVNQWNLYTIVYYSLLLVLVIIVSRNMLGDKKSKALFE